MDINLGKEFWIGFGVGTATGVASDEGARAIARYWMKRKEKKEEEKKD